MNGPSPLPVVRRRTPSARRVASVAAIIFVAWLLSVAAFGLFARTERACVACHSMRVYDEARNPSHAAAPCGECHSSSGPLGVVVDGLAMQRRVISTTVGRPPSPLAPVSDTPCRDCHSQTRRSVVTSKGITVRHEEFWGSPCTMCHAGTGHELVGRSYSTTNMDDCLGCHRTSATDLVGCALCHGQPADERTTTAATPWRTTHGPEWKTTHGAGNLDTCDSCHDTKYCSRCHGTQIPHSPTWARSHGQVVLRLGKDNCRTCHEDTWCDSCHGMPMPHPDGFLADHSTSASSVSDAACLRCHDVASCEACHIGHTHPDVPGAGFPENKVGEK